MAGCGCRFHLSVGAHLDGTASDRITTLSGVAEPVSAVTRRNALIYAAFAVGVLGLQLGLLATVDETALPVFAPLCLLGLPALAWAAGWLTVGFSFGSESQLDDDADAARVRRSSRLGAMICLAPNLLLCCWLFALFVFG